MNLLPSLKYIRQLGSIIELEHSHIPNTTCGWGKKEPFKTTTTICSIDHEWQMVMILYRTMSYWFPLEPAIYVQNIWKTHNPLYPITLRGCQIVHFAPKVAPHTWPITHSLRHPPRGMDQDSRERFDCTYKRTRIDAKSRSSISTANAMHDVRHFSPVEPTNLQGVSGFSQFGKPVGPIQRTSFLSLWISS